MFLVKSGSPSERLALVTEYISKLKRKLGRFDGYYGASAWESVESGDEIMILVEFRQDDCGDNTLQRFSRDKLAFEEANLAASPADVTVFEVQSSSGLRPSDASSGQYLSVSRRIASPGLGEELERELDWIFGSLAVIPGYLGHLYGSHVSVSDKVLGLVLWESEESFRKSLPKSAPYRLHLYRKVL
jgi:hypothetical protein